MRNISRNQPFLLHTSLRTPCEYGAQCPVGVKRSHRPDSGPDDDLQRKVSTTIPVVRRGIGALSPYKISPLNLMRGELLARRKKDATIIGMSYGRAPTQAEGKWKSFCFLVDRSQREKNRGVRKEKKSLFWVSGRGYGIIRFTQWGNTYTVKVGCRSSQNIKNTVRFRIYKCFL